MEAKKYVFVVSHAMEKPMEVIGLLKIATNMKAFDDAIALDLFLVGEGVLLARKGTAEKINVEMEGQLVKAGEMLSTLIDDFGVKVYVCHGFMPEYGMTKDDLIKNAELKSSSFLGEMLLDGRVPFQLNL